MNIYSLWKKKSTFLIFDCLNWDYNKTILQADITKGGIMSEGTGGYLLLQNNIPNLYSKLLYPVFDNEKILKVTNTL